MRTRTLFAYLFVLFTVQSSYAQQSETQLAYINRYKDIAVREMERAGIPASIKLAQGILESNAGQSVLARRAKNHFGIKCGANWQGGTVYREAPFCASRKGAVSLSRALPSKRREKPCCRMAEPA